MLYNNYGDGELLVAITVDYFLVLGSKQTNFDSFHKYLEIKYILIRIGSPKRYVGWRIHTKADGIITLGQPDISKATVKAVGLKPETPKLTPYNYFVPVHGPDDTEPKYEKDAVEYQSLVGEL